MKAKQAGFTILEVMIVIALLAVLVGIGAPSLGEFIRNSRMTSKANDLLAGLNLARSEAIKRRVPVTVCASADALAEQPVCDPNADFSQWIVFVDSGSTPGPVGNATYEQSQGEQLLSRSTGSISSIRTLPVTSVGGYIQYGVDGFQRRANGSAPTDLVIRMCDDRKNKAVSGSDTSAARALFVSRTGRAEVTRSATRITAAGDCP